MSKKPAIIYCVFASLFCWALLGCGSLTRLPASDYPRTASYATSPAEDNSLRRAIHKDAVKHPGLSGLRLIPRGDDALLIRLALIQAAENSLDVQYYSIMNDKSGKLLLEALLTAADRGVRVRILADDITIKKSDPIWPLLDSHKNISFRLFNPLATEEQGIAGKVGGVFTGISHFTRRMHNKAFIADNQVSIIGGRNLGDAYFDSSQEFNFRDIDMIAAGPITSLVSKSFDRYWNSRDSFPIRQLGITSSDQKGQDTLRNELKANWERAVKGGELAELPSILTQLRDNDPPLEWAKVELAADSPTKTEKPRDETDSKPMARLRDLAAQAKREIIVVSPYFVAGDDGVEWLKDLVGRGVHVRALTNSLASTDVVAVHAGYSRYREALLDAGVSLYELKPVPGKHPRSGRFASSSRASLHTKTYIIDHKDIVLGTMNLDPRSIELNTEVALVVHDAKLAEHIAEMFGRITSPASSYHVIQRKDGNDTSLEWVTEENGGK